MKIQSFEYYKACLLAFMQYRGIPEAPCDYRHQTAKFSAKNFRTKFFH